METIVNFLAPGQLLVIIAVLVFVLSVVLISLVRCNKALKRCDEFRCRNLRLARFFVNLVEKDKLSEIVECFRLWFDEIDVLKNCGKTLNQELKEFEKDKEFYKRVIVLIDRAL